MARLGGPVFGDVSTTAKWVEAVKRHGYRSAYCPVGVTASHDQIDAYSSAAAENGIVIAEVGAWSNPISLDSETRTKAIKGCIAALTLAERIGASCCVNIAGARGEQWDGPYADNFSEPTFELIVKTVREIIDAVKPDRTFYTLETMPWIHPDSVESYVKLIHAIDRKAFAVHLDPCNMIVSPRTFFGNAALIRDCFAQLGPWIKSLHAKDIALAGVMTVHLSEVRPGLGALDYATLLAELDRLNPDLPLMLEHLPNEDEYLHAARYLRTTFPSHFD